MNDQLSGLEKATLFTIAAANAFNILLWSLGFTLSDARPDGPIALWAVRVTFAIVSFIAFDLTLVVTVMATRAGRRSRWAWLTVAAVAVVAGAIGLDVAGVVAWPALHAAPVLILGAFALHLAAPRERLVPERELISARAELSQLAHDARDTVELRGRVAQLEDEAAHLRGEAVGAAQRAAQAEGQMREIAARPPRTLPASAPTPAQIARELRDGRLEIVQVARELAGISESKRDAAQRLGWAESTLRERLREKEAA